MVRIEHGKVVVARHDPRRPGSKRQGDFGVVEYRPAETVHDLAKRLDDARYRTKERGRDRVEVDGA